jgi:hypothetical protein
MDSIVIKKKNSNNSAALGTQEQRLGLVLELDLVGESRRSWCFGWPSAVFAWTICKSFVSSDEFNAEDLWIGSSGFEVFRLCNMMNDGNQLPVEDF